MSDIDTRLDEIATLNKMAHPELDGACYICGINPTLIKQLMADEFEKLISEDEPVDMSFGRTEDQIIRDTCYTQGVNETKAELRQKLEEWKK